MSSATSTSSASSSNPPGFSVSHFFVLLALMAATVAVVMARPAAPETLVLISLTIGAAAVAATAFYRMLAPLVAPQKEYAREPLSARLRADLEREKALTLRSIKELEFDRAMGKVSEQDFAQMAGRLRERALGIMKQLEAGTSAYRQQIEKELASRVGGAPALKSRPTSESRPAPAESRPALQGRLAPTEGRPALQGRRCACGTSNDADARFCKACGNKLTESMTERTE